MGRSLFIQNLDLVGKWQKTKRQAEKKTKESSFVVSEREREQMYLYRLYGDFGCFGFLACFILIIYTRGQIGYSSGALDL